MVEVINIKKCKDFGTREGDVYIGRYNSRFGASKWGNPFTIGDRETLIKQYAVYLHSSGLIADIYDLANAKRLGCWCKPRMCHGDVLKKYVDEWNGVDTEERHDKRCTVRTLDEWISDERDEN
jgi:hypothetical protein